MLEIPVVVGISIIALIVAGSSHAVSSRRTRGRPRCSEVADAIRVGAEAFIKRQYSTIAILAIVLAVVIFCVYYFTGQQALAADTALAYLVGAFCSALAGVIGMSVAVRSNVRTAAAAQTSAAKALDFSFRGGAISGLIITSMSLLGVSLTYYALGANPQVTPFIIVGLASAPRLSPSLPSSAAVSTRRPLMSVQTLSARSRPVSLKTMSGTRPPSQTLSGTTSGTVPAVALTSSSPPQPRTSVR